MSCPLKTTRCGPIQLRSTLTTSNAGFPFRSTTRMLCLILGSSPAPIMLSKRRISRSKSATFSPGFHVGTPCFSSIPRSSHRRPYWRRTKRRRGIPFSLSGKEKRAHLLSSVPFLVGDVVVISTAGWPRSRLSPRDPVPTPSRPLSRGCSSAIGVHESRRSPRSATRNTGSHTD